MRKIKNVINMGGEESEQACARLKERIDEGVTFLRKAQEGNLDQLGFSFVAYELFDVVKDVGMALTGKEFVLEKSSGVISTAKPPGSVYKADDLACPYCKHKIVIAGPGNVFCPQCNAYLQIGTVPRIGSSDELSITRSAPCVNRGSE